MAKSFLILSALAGGLAVILGAFAAHGFKTRLEPVLLTAFKTGVEYQFYHALALFGVAILLQRWQGGGVLIAAGIFFTLGILLFSGSLYGLALLQWQWLGPITPLGGLCFILGWACLLTGAVQHSD